ncbi:MAG: acetylornithine/succinylornithine family transaminase [Ruminococcaceae bacterium]|nr:acetylornithine/succinylornithine family transaminase [Oscillospiraceae bacterium]
MDIKILDSTYVADTYARFPVEIVSGKGSIVKDSHGKEYIDLSTGIAVNTFGLCDDKWIKVVNEQINLFQHTSNLYYSAPCAKLAQLMCEKTGMKKVFFSNSGAEANECAIKTARKYAAEKHGAEYYNIITLTGSFHGRTITTLAATGQDVFHKTFTPLTEGFIYCETNNSVMLEKLAVENKVAAIMFEPLQGEGGVNPLDKDFVETVVKIAKEKDILLIADEVQCGNGRTGKLYGYMNFGITPDIVSTAKGLGGGLPIGATMFNEKTCNVLGRGDHGSTFGGNPIACAGALSIFERLDNELLEGVKERSDYIKSSLEGAPGIKSVTGLGLMLGIETERDASEVIAKCMENGVMPIKAKRKVRLLPALNIPMDQLRTAIEVIKEAAKPE